MGERVFKSDWPHTHTQYKDRPGDDLADCPAGDHHYVDDDDGDVITLAVCTRCGASDVEPERG